jgi:hypothetical protein
MKMQEMILHYSILFFFNSAETTDNDIALIKVDSTVGIEMGLRIQPACLPNYDLVYRDDLECSISGWGRTKKGLASYFAKGIYE